jgi:hypothetical protein
VLNTILLLKDTVIHAGKRPVPTASPQTLASHPEKQLRADKGGFFSTARSLFGLVGGNKTLETGPQQAGGVALGGSKNPSVGGGQGSKKKPICPACLLGLSTAILKSEHEGPCPGLQALGGKEDGKKALTAKKTAAMVEMKAPQIRESDFSSWAYLGFLQK